MKEDRMRFARIRAPENDQVGLFNLLIRACAPTRPEDCRQTGDAWGMSSAVTAVDVVAAHNDTSKLLRQKVQFVGRFGAAEQAERVGTACLFCGGETSRCLIKRLVPRGNTKASTVAHKGPFQTRKTCAHAGGFCIPSSRPSYVKLAGNGGHNI
jgi:hypothetical protein